MPIMGPEPNEVVVAVSGGFDPVHIGHIRMFKEARALGNKLLVILNDDEWLMRKKGYVFMPLSERKELLENFSCVDEVVVREPRDTYDVSHMLEILPVHIFANGGNDRRNEGEIPEATVCTARGIEMIFGVGGADKPQSSSWLTENVAKRFTGSDKLPHPPKSVE